MINHKSLASVFAVLLAAGAFAQAKQASLSTVQEAEFTTRSKAVVGWLDAANKYATTERDVALLSYLIERSAVAVRSKGKFAYFDPASTRPLLLIGYLESDTEAEAKLKPSPDPDTGVVSYDFTAGGLQRTMKVKTYAPLTERWKALKVLRETFKVYAGEEICDLEGYRELEALADFYQQEKLTEWGGKPYTTFIAKMAGSVKTLTTGTWQEIKRLSLPREQITKWFGAVKDEYEWRIRDRDIRAHILATAINNMVHDEDAVPQVYGAYLRY